MFVTLMHKAGSLCSDTQEIGTTSRPIGEIVSRNLDCARTKIHVRERGDEALFVPRDWRVLHQE
jgi:hypothetical protein